MKQNREARNRLTLPWAIDFWQGHPNISMEKGKSFEPMLLEQLDIQMGKKNRKSYLKQYTENNMRWI